jgi:hypothetical protein
VLARASVWFPNSVSVGVARVPVLPRKVAAGVSVFAVARCGWVVAAVVLLVCIPGVIVVFDQHHYSADLAEPLVGLGIMLLGLAVAGLNTRALTLVVYIVVGGLGNYLFVYGMVAGHPVLLPAALVLINRPETALVLVGTNGQRPLPAVAWGLGGFAAGGAATAIAYMQLGIPIQLGNGPGITLANYCAVYLCLSVIQRSQRQRVPDFLQLRSATRRIEAERTADQRAVALLHDTVLNDLALIINGPDKLDVRMTTRMLRDVETLANTSAVGVGPSDVLLDAGDAAMRNHVMSIVSDLQWRGLTVEVTGDTGAVYRMTQEVADAAAGALRASLENVLRHSGADAAEIIVSATDDAITWTVNDAGHGFDPGAIGADRLGLRSSVFRRVESVGGVVKVWSAPENGTSVLFTVPLLPRPLEDNGVVDA